jgi:hypothetical protein
MSVPRFRKQAQVSLSGFVESSSNPQDKNSVEFAQGVLRQLQSLDRNEIAVLDVKIGQLFPGASSDF